MDHLQNSTSIQAILCIFIVLSEVISLVIGIDHDNVVIYCDVVEALIVSKYGRLIVLTIESNMDLASCPLLTLCWYENFSKLSISKIFVSALRREVCAREELLLVKIEEFTFI